MKKIISVLLAILLIFSMTIPAFASVDYYNVRSQMPVIVVSGDGADITNADGEKITTLSNFATALSGSGEDGDKSNIKDAVLNIIEPLIIDGILGNEWDGYYKAVQNEVSDIFADMLLDGDGNPQNGTDVAQNLKDANAYDVTYNRYGDKQFYDRGDYTFWYDWRLDPIYNADKLHDYIEGVKKASGHDEVAIITRCVGSSVVYAYMEKYGLDGIHGIGFDGITGNGCDVLTEVFTGNFTIDGDAINRFIADANALGLTDLSDLLTTTIDALEKTGLLDGMKSTAKKLVYNKIGQGVASAIILSTFSLPCYWASISYDKFDDAVNYVFGPEGSEKRTEYAGLIEKITTYNETVKKNIPDLMLSIPENGLKIGIISKYGLQMTPTGKNSNNLVADQIVSVKNSSFGATTGTVYETLSDKYIAQQEALGLGKYISPDKLIDASTCLFPDYTWFEKGVSHSKWTYAEDQLLVKVITADTQYTVDDFDCSQFVLGQADYWSPFEKMTEENCNTENWDESSTAVAKSPLERIMNMVKALLKWFSAIINRIMNSSKTETVEP